jgi:hypothetical protein
MYEININGVTSTFDGFDPFADAVADAISEWTTDAVCERFDGSDVICCANHPTARFDMCPVCVAMDIADRDYDQYWSVSDAPGLPYELRLPASGNMDPVKIVAREV